MQFVGRMRLTSVASTKASTHPIGDDGKPDRSRYIMRPSVQATFTAVKDGDDEDTMFGVYTPSGEAKLTIANPSVAGELQQAWHDYVMEEDEPGISYPQYSNEKMPVYEVTFRRIR